LHQSWHAYSLSPGSEHRRAKIAEKVSLVRFPVRTVPAARKLCKIDERRQRPKLYVSKRRLQKQRPQPRKTVLGSSPDEDIFCSSETKHDRRTAPRQNLFVSARKLQELRSHTRKLSWVRVSVKVLGLGIPNFSCDIQRYVSNDQVYGKLSSIKASKQAFVEFPRSNNK
jgi:hypothetical protein